VAVCFPTTNCHAIVCGGVKKKGRLFGLYVSGAAISLMCGGKFSHHKLWRGVAGNQTRTKPSS
jgi:hypothetical protein